MMTEELTFNKEYHNQDPRCTAMPYIVEVQQEKFFGIVSDDTLVSSCDGEIKTTYTCKDFMGEEFETEQELKDFIADEYSQIIDDDDIDEIRLGYVWHPVAIFFTVKEAEKFINGRASFRTWIRHIDSQETEMVELMKLGGLYNE